MSPRTHATVRSLALALGAASMLLWGCTDSAQIQRFPLEPDPSVGRLTLAPTSTRLGYLGARTTLTAVVRDESGDPIPGLSYAWSSSNPSVATVDVHGTVTAVAEGSARIVVRVVNLMDTATIEVKRVPATIALSPDTIVVTTPDSSVQLATSVLDGGGQPLTDAPLVWMSSDTTVATVSATGLVTAHGNGRAEISARSENVTGTAMIVVAIGPASVSVEPAAVALDALRDTLRLRATVRDAVGAPLPNVPVSWTSSDTSVATISETGLVTAMARGATTLTVRGDTVKATVAVTITQTAASVAISPKSATVQQGSTVQLSASASDRNGFAISNPSLTWSVTDTAVAQVSQTGLVTARSAGTVGVVAAAGFVADTASLTVTNVPVASLSVSPDSVSLTVGQATQLTVKAYDAGGSELFGVSPSWTSRASGVASVSTGGEVQALSAGSTWIVARADAALDSAYVRVSAPPTGAFSIDLRYVGTPPSSSQQAAFSAAVSRWESIITGDLPDIPLNAPDSACGIPHPAVKETVDDVLVFAEVTTIDGPGGTLGQGGPCYVRTSDGLTVMGIIELDSADVVDLQASGDLTAVITHEFGHVLGFGTVTPWTSVLVGKGGDDPYWPGVTAVAKYRLAGGAATNAVPVANTGGEGTRDVHWRESDMGRELMTGYINSGAPNPLSAITVGAFQDMGYVVDFAEADPYTVGPAFMLPARVIELKERPMLAPRGVDPSGRIVPPVGG